MVILKRSGISEVVLNVEGRNQNAPLLVELETAETGKKVRMKFNPIQNERFISFELENGVTETDKGILNLKYDTYFFTIFNGRDEDFEKVGGELKNGIVKIKE